MKVNIFFEDYLKKDFFEFFFKQSKKISFDIRDFNEFKNFTNHCNLLLFDTKKFLESFLDTNIDSLSGLTKNIFFVPSNLIKTINNNSFKIVYPSRFDSLENKIINFFDKKNNFYKNLILKKNNILINSDNNLKTHLTETEYKMLKSFFEKNIIEKKFLTQKILNQSAQISSNSIDTHLYRLRKKIEKVDTKIKIKTIDYQLLKII